MRVLIDAFWWCDGPPSGRNVVRSLVLSWVEHFPEDRLTIVVAAGNTERAVAEVASLNVEVVEYPAWARVHALAVLTLRVAKHEFDLVLTNNFGAPGVRAPSAVLVYDAIFVTSPQWFTRKERAYLAGIRPSLRFADAVLTISDHEAERISSVWPEVAPKVQVSGLAVPLGIERAESRRPELPIGDGEPFALAVGRLNVRKNLQNLLDGFSESAFCAGGGSLLIVGEPNGRAGGLSSGQQVHFLQNIGDAELKWLYEKCAVFVFPSLDEGFGLPLIEAASAGAWVMASDIPVFRELDIADRYFEPSSVSDIAIALAASFPADKNPRRPFLWADVVRRVRQGPARNSRPVRGTLNGLLNSRYIAARGVQSGLDPQLSDADLVTFVRVKLMARLRGVSRGYLRTYLGSHVRLRSRRSLSLGSGVSIGDGVMIDAMSVEGVRLQDAATVDRDAIIRGSGGVRRLGRGVSVGRRAAIGAQNFIQGGGGVVIGDDVLLGPGVRIFSENHRFDVPNVPIIEQGEEPSEVRIGDGAWLGAGVVVLAGVTIGGGAVVAAGAVVTKDLPEGSLSAGVPAKVIGWRPGFDPASRSYGTQC